MIRVELKLRYVETKNGAHVFEEAWTDARVAVPIELLPEAFVDMAEGEGEHARRELRFILEGPLR